MLGVSLGFGLLDTLFFISLYLYLPMFEQNTEKLGHLKWSWYISWHVFNGQRNNA